MRKPLTREEAVAMYESRWWEGKTAREIVAFQLFEDRLCMDVTAFGQALNEALGRAVFTHEFNSESLRDEFKNLREGIR